MKTDAALFDELSKIIDRPQPFEFYTTPEFWNDPHISQGMLAAHLNPAHDAASYRRELIDQALDWISSHFSIVGKRICDFGCGPGLYTTGMAQRGGLVTGIDVSTRSLQYARDTAAAQGLTINYVQQNYLDFSSTARFDLITMISRDFSVLSPVQARTLLQTVHTLLSPDGAVLLDVDSGHAFAAANEETTYTFYPEGGFWAAGSHHLFTSRFKYEPEMLLLQKYTLVERRGSRTFYNWQQCYRPSTLIDLFTHAGFSLEATYGNIAGAPFDFDNETLEMAIVARKGI